jgi:hypothetical protein
MKSIEFINEKALSKKDIFGSLADPHDQKRKLARLIAFVEKVVKGIPFKTIDGQEVVIKKTQDLLTGIKNRVLPNLLDIEPKGQIKLSQLEKTSEFGGEVAGKRLAKEKSAMDDLNTQIQSLKGDKPYITLIVGDKKVKAAKIQNTPGTPKSDFEVVDDKNKTVAWISHKDGSPALPTKFGQWAGASKFSDHPEVKAFLKAITKQFPEGMDKGATAISLPVKDKKLQMMAVYGKDFGSKSFGLNNVNTVLQGPPQIVKKGKNYVLTALAEFKNGDNLPESYKPVLIARYIGDRSDFGLAHTRISLYPKFGRKTQELIAAKIASTVPKKISSLKKPSKEVKKILNKQKNTLGRTKR